MLDDLIRVTSVAKKHRDRFIEICNANTTSATKKVQSAKKRELSKSERRLSEIKRLFVKICEDNALGKLTDEDYALLFETYKTEQAQLEHIKIDEENTERFLKIVYNYTDITELTNDLLRDFVDKI